MKKAIIIGIILLILTVGAVSADENQTADEITHASELDSNIISNDSTANTEIDNSFDLSKKDETGNDIAPNPTATSENTANKTKENVVIGDYGFYMEGDVVYKTVTPEEVMDPYGLQGQYGIYIEKPENSPYEMAGNITFYIDNKIVPNKDLEKYDLGVTSGYILWKEYVIGNHTIEVVYSGDDNFNAAKKTFNYLYLGYIITGAKDTIMNYNDGKTIKLKLYKYDKPAGANKVVTIEIGKQTFKVKTDKDGVIKFKIPNTVTPGKYKMEISYKNVYISKKLTVNQVLSINEANVKKSGKKLVLTATLKKESTPIKDKQVTFKFNGKTYKAKTNNKGIAKVTIPKSVLSKLKVGKTVTYQATYLKDTVKKTAKVKK